MPGHISESISEFDGIKTIKMEPGWIGSGPIKLGLVYSSNLPDSLIIMPVLVRGINSFSNGKSLHFNIDGEFISIESSGKSFIEIDWSSKNYPIKKSLIKKLIDGQRVWVKVDLIDEIVEGEFSSDAPGSARTGFRNFYIRLSELQ